MKNFLILTVLLAAVGAYTWFTQGAAPPAPAASPSARVPALLFSAKTIEGKNIRLDDFKGKAVVLNFWATWCAPCVVEFPMMIQLAKATSEEAVFLFVSVDEDRAAIDRFLARYAAPLPMDNVHVIWDPEKGIAEKLYGTFKLPETYLIDGQGNIRDKIIGADIDWTSADMQRNLRQMAGSGR